MHISELHHAVTQRATSYSGCNKEQALTYACEDVVSEIMGARLLTSDEMSLWLEDVCESEDIDAPLLAYVRRSSSVIASVDIEHNIVCLRNRDITTAVLLHELGHLVSQSHNHDQLFRSAVVGLWRRHLSVEHAALLWQLFAGAGLPTDTWSVDK